MERILIIIAIIALSAVTVTCGIRGIYHLIKYFKGE